MRRHREEEIRSFSGLLHRVEQAQNGNRSSACLRFRPVFREVLCLSVSPAASLSSNANATAFACYANPTTRYVFAKMGITTARTVATPVTFARKGDCSGLKACIKVPGCSPQLLCGRLAAENHKFSGGPGRQSVLTKATSVTFQGPCITDPQHPPESASPPAYQACVPVAISSNSR